MFRRILALLLSLTLCTGITVFSENVSEDDNVEIIEARLDNAVEASRGLKYDSIDAIKNDDYTKALFYANEEKNPAYVVYKSEQPFRSFGVELYMYRWHRVDMKFYVSKDGKDWKFANIQLYNLVKTKHTDIYEANEQYHRIFKGEHLEDDYNYLKLEFPTKISSLNVVKIHFCSSDLYDIVTNGRVAHSQKPDFDYSTIKSLRDAFEGYFDIGVSIEPWDINQYEELLDSQFDVITTENQFKGHVFQQGPDQW